MDNKAPILIGLASPGRYYLTCPGYDGELAGFLRSFNGVSWDRENQFWSFPVSARHISAIKDRYGARIVFEPSCSLVELCREIRIRQMSRHTLDAYFFYNRELLRHVKKHPHELTDGDIRSYIEYLTVDKKSAPATVNLAIDAIKFFLCEVRRMKLFLSPRPRKGVRLPVVLSAEEVLRLFDVTANLKHRAILMIAYSSGLRVGETAVLMVGDIDFDRKLVRIRQGKGRKDRYTVLSVRAETVIRSYMETYRPIRWLFEGQKRDQHISIRSIQHLFEDAVRRAKISKDVTFHGLRHSFATHLLENGIDIKYIQSLLGHKKIQTTEIYTHVQRKKIESIRSPLDML